MEGDEQSETAPRAAIIRGAILGAILVALPAIALSELIREPAHPAVLAAIALFGAICGAYAAGVIRYEHDHDPGLHPLAAAPRKPAPEEAAEPTEPPAPTLWGRSRAALARLPLVPWL